jgi:hypothetical protein
VEHQNIPWYLGADCVVTFNREPNTRMVRILPSMTAGEKRDAARYPFINCSGLHCNITYKGKQYELFIPKGFRWDGATIAPIFWLLIGSKTDNRFRLPSMIHDYMCNNKYTVDFDRKLSSVVFRALLRVNGVPGWKITLMYWAVDTYQRFQKEWTK